MKSYAIPLSLIRSAATSRPAGYVEDVLSAGTIDGDRVILEETAYAALLRRYSGRTIVQARAMSQPAPSGGPGTELKKLLKEWLGIEETPGCKCKSMAAQMDRMGVEWSTSDDGMSEIVEVMRAEHAKRWTAGKTILPWSDTAARALIRLACHRARAKAAS